MQRSSLLPLLILAGLYTLVVLDHVHGMNASMGRSSMTAEDGSSIHVAFRARTESEERLNFVLHTPDLAIVHLSLIHI